MILIFLGSFRATVAVCLSIPLSALATFLVLALGGSSVNAMVLGGLALVFSRLIDNSVVVLENIYRHLENGVPAPEAAERGGQEVALAGAGGDAHHGGRVLPGDVPVRREPLPVLGARAGGRHRAVRLLLRGDDGRAAVLRALSEEPARRPIATARRQDGAAGSTSGSTATSTGCCEATPGWWARALRRPVTVHRWRRAVVFAASLLLYPRLGVAFFPRTDAGQFVINLKAAPGTRLEITSSEMARVEQLVRQVVAPEDLGMIVSNIGVAPGFSSIYTSNSAQHTAFVQVSLREGHKTGSYEYMNRMRRRLAEELPQLSAYFQSGGLVDAVLNLGLPAPIDLQVSGSDLRAAHAVASGLAARIRGIANVSDVFIPQDIDYPALALDIDRVRASRLGLTQREVVSNVITALTSNQMIAPSYWVDQRTGNDYMLTVQYPGKPGREHAGSHRDSPARPEGARARAPGCRDVAAPVHGADRSESLSAAPRRRHLRGAGERGSGEGRGGDRPDRGGDDVARRRARGSARHGAGHARVVPQLRIRTAAGGRPALPDPGGAVRVVCRSADHPAGRAAGPDRRARHAVSSPGRR